MTNTQPTNVRGSLVNLPNTNSWLPIAALVVIGLFFTSTAHAERPPNVIFIMADDLGYGDLSCYGATHFETPSCDRLARQGMRFTDAHSPSAVCTPTRYSVLTGRYAWRGWLKNWVLFEEHTANSLSSLIGLSARYSKHWTGTNSPTTRSWW